MHPRRRILAKRPTRPYPTDKEYPLSLRYDNFERLSLVRPVDRLGWIAETCRGKTVLDVGCFDETALQKRNTEHWLHGRIAALARRVIGIDSSAMIPLEGLSTGPSSSIHRGDGVHFDPSLIGGERIDVVVAGEFIEHIENPLEFMRDVRLRMPGVLLVLSTPNGVSFANTLMGMLGREVQHPDHLHSFTYKVLNTLCLRAGFSEWQIIPYRFYATEMILRSRGAVRLLAMAAERFIRVVEYCFPLLCFGYIVEIKV